MVDIERQIGRAKGKTKFERMGMGSEDYVESGMPSPVPVPDGWLISS
jgi:hypothetical protein